MNIVYLRVSSNEQDPQQQLKDVLTIVEGDYTLIEEKASAYKLKQERFNKEVLSRIEKGEVRNLYVWDSDRIARNWRQMTKIVDVCFENNCKIRTFTPSILNDINSFNDENAINEVTKKFIVMLLGAVAEEESRVKSRRVKKAVRKKNNGTFSTRGNKWGRKSIPMRTQKHIYREYKRGVSVPEIMATIQTSKNGNSKPISRATIYNIIKAFKEDKKEDSP